MERLNFFNSILHKSLRNKKEESNSPLVSKSRVENEEASILKLKRASWKLDLVDTNLIKFNNSINSTIKKFVKIEKSFYLSMKSLWDEKQWDMNLKKNELKAH